MVALKLLPFDAHNHIQLGPPPNPLSLASRSSHELIDDDNRNVSFENDRMSLVGSLGEYIREELQGKHLSGMAIMATHPRDFSTILGLEQEIQQQQTQTEGKDTNTVNACISNHLEESMKILPCLGVHPWFLHELDPDVDWALVSSSLDNDELVPKWTAELEELLQRNPRAPVGEIGLDGFHFRSEGGTQELTTPMDKQIEAFLLQLKIATRLQRPVSLHCVRAMGKIMDALDEVASENHKRWVAKVEKGVWNHEDDELMVLPPRIYFHAFGGKASTVTQLIKTLEKPRRIKLPQSNTKQKKFVKITPTKVYFGFAPPVNFQSPKTPSVIQAVGLERLVLETDREDIRAVGPDCQQAVPWLASVLGISEEELVRVTNANVQDLYYSRETSSQKSAT
uniref:TatD related DNase n=1 Tax=Pseudo-nitzschia australis TaxID=44445 RepID=A0A7S4EIR1_9STRA|mmetsp:Transcript_13730/g.28785  ORF Transcript_13730/g.28785 Transcript_13730/m.28785 type:complete len:396 (-) Transcript_13730:155-1342(-)